MLSEALGDETSHVVGILSTIDKNTSDIDSSLPLAVLHGKELASRRSVGGLDWLQWVRGVIVLRARDHDCGLDRLEGILVRSGADRAPHQDTPART
ncbi:MAG: hypothetical protein U1E76_22710 [Planctomycetota bacterium]